MKHSRRIHSLSSASLVHLPPRRTKYSFHKWIRFLICIHKIASLHTRIQVQYICTTYVRLRLRVDVYNKIFLPKWSTKHESYAILHEIMLFVYGLLVLLDGITSNYRLCSRIKCNFKCKSLSVKRVLKIWFSAHVNPFMSLIRRAKSSFFSSLRVLFFSFAWESVESFEIYFYRFM